MFWWFERKGELLRLEVLELGPDRFEMRVTRADGVETVETFSNAQALAKRQEQVHRDVAKQGWTGPHGWIM